MIDELAIPDLDDAEIAQLESYGTRRVAQAGDYLYRAGDAAYDFYVVLSGLIEVVLRVDGEEQIIVQHGPGRFLGELNLLTGLRVFVSAGWPRPAKSSRSRSRSSGASSPPSHNSATRSW